MLGWLETVGIKALLDWIWGILTKAVLAYEAQKKAHESAVNQAKQDSSKAKVVNKETEAGKVDEAIDDELSHL